MKKHLIIQGPMTSTGRTGEDIVNDTHYHDANDNVKRIIETYGNYFDTIVLSTWVDEPITFQTDVPYLLVQGEMPDKINVDGKGNQNRQFASIYNGLGELSRKTIIDSRDIIVKTRTDIFVDLKSIVQSTPKGRICVPHYNLTYYVSGLEGPSTIGVHDFYLSGEAYFMNTFISSMVMNDPLNLGWKVHQEMLIKFAYTHYELLKPFKEHMFNKTNTISETQRYILKHVLKTSFYPLLKEIFLNLEWRGKKANNEFIKFHSSPNLIYTDRYNELGQIWNK